jgi:hypothetical protein
MKRDRSNKFASLTLLGNSEATFPRSPREARIETFPNPKPSRDYNISIRQPTKPSRSQATRSDSPARLPKPSPISITLRWSAPGRIASGIHSLTNLAFTSFYEKSPSPTLATGTLVSTPLTRSYSTSDEPVLVVAFASGSETTSGARSRTSRAPSS